jgi:hypothetical protein
MRSDAPNASEGAARRGDMIAQDDGRAGSIRLLDGQTVQCCWLTNSPIAIPLSPATV